MLTAKYQADWFSALLPRIKAAGIHLAISALLIGSAFLLIIRVWYPGGLFYAGGGNRLIMFLAGVDVVIGPLLTLVVFDRSKKNLKLDLSCIALLQLSALVYGAYTVFQARPAFVVFAKDRFELVRAVELTDESLDAASDLAYRARPLRGPVWVGLRFPKNPGEQLELFASAVQGLDMQFMPRYYVPLSENAEEVSRRALPLTRLLNSGSNVSGLLDSTAFAKVARSDVGYVPLNAKNESMTVLVNMKTGELLDIVRVNPW